MRFKLCDICMEQILIELWNFFFFLLSIWIVEIRWHWIKEIYGNQSLKTHIKNVKFSSHSLIREEFFFYRKSRHVGVNEEQDKTASTCVWCYSALNSKEALISKTESESELYRIYQEGCQQKRSFCYLFFSCVV